MIFRDWWSGINYWVTHFSLLAIIYAESLAAVCCLQWTAPAEFDVKHVLSDYLYFNNLLYFLENPCRAQIVNGVALTAIINHEMSPDC